MTFDQRLTQLRQLLLRLVEPMLVDCQSIVRRALLTDLVKLSVSLGRSSTVDMLLSHVITFLNDGDWMLRQAFFRHVAAISAYLCSDQIDRYIFPLILQSFTGAVTFQMSQAHQFRFRGDSGSRCAHGCSSTARFGTFISLKLTKLVLGTMPSCISSQFKDSIMCLEMLTECNQKSLSC